MDSDSNAILATSRSSQKQFQPAFETIDLASCPSDIAGTSSRTELCRDLEPGYGSRRTKEEKRVEEEEEEREDVRCGLGSCKPDCLQRCNNSKCLLAWLCWFAFIQGILLVVIAFLYYNEMIHCIAQCCTVLHCDDTLC